MEGNLGPRQRLRRCVLGTLSGSAAIGLAATFAPSAISFLALWLLTSTTAACFLQARVSTCVLLAYRGLRNLDCGPEPVLDPATRARDVATAGRIVGGCVAFGSVATLALALWMTLVV